MIPWGQAYRWGNILQDSRVTLVNVLRPETGREMFSINGRGLTFQSGRFSHHVNGAESFRFCQLEVQEKRCLKTIYCIFLIWSCSPSYLTLSCPTFCPLVLTEVIFLPSSSLLYGAGTFSLPFCLARPSMALERVQGEPERPPVPGIEKT